MDGNQNPPDALLEALRVRFDARAAGWWRVSADRSELKQVAFTADDRMPGEVSRSFALATLVVPFGATDLGIVKAAISGQVAVSRLSEISAKSGSGLWLVRFKATRSVAVPVFDRLSEVMGVISLALGSDGEEDVKVARALQEAAASWHDDAVTGLSDHLPGQ